MARTTQVYRHRFEDDYLQLTVEMEDGYDEMNERLRKKYADIYIDMIAMVQKQDGRSRCSLTMDDSLVRIADT